MVIATTGRVSLPRRICRVVAHRQSVCLDWRVRCYDVLELFCCEDQHTKTTHYYPPAWQPTTTMYPHTTPMCMCVPPFTTHVRLSHTRTQLSHSTHTHVCRCPCCSGRAWRRKRGCGLCEAQSKRTILCAENNLHSPQLKQPP